MTHPEHTLFRNDRDDSRQAHRLQQILDVLPQPVMLFQPDGRVEYVNAAAQRRFGLPHDNQHGHDYAHGTPHSCPGEQASCPFDEALSQRRRVRQEQCHTDADGRVRYVEVTVAPLLDADGQVEALLETHHDITARKQEEMRLQLLQGQLTELAHRDPLTNLSNRRYLELKLDTLARDKVSRPCALLFIDLDRFKPINDLHGHVIGDRVLTLLAGRLRAAVRTSDLPVRVGGDEFAILLENSNDAGAKAVAGKIMQALVQPIAELPLPNQVGVSIGIALFATGEAMPDDLISQADAAMYRAKRRGGNERELVRL